MPPKKVSRWPDAGFAHLQTNAHGGLVPLPNWWLHWLARPELALVDESCSGERALHKRLQQDPLAPVLDADLQRIADADVRESWQLFTGLRASVQAALTLQAWYRQLFDGRPVQVPPLFIDTVAQLLIQQQLQEDEDTVLWRCAELFFRLQRVAFEQGRVLAADAATVAEHGATQGLGEIGRLLAQARVQALPLQLPVLGPDNTARYVAEAERSPFRSSLLLDISSPQMALARLLERWVLSLLGVQVRIEPVPEIKDSHWRWHIGLDVEASRLLDEMYTGSQVPAERLERVIGLFKLSFNNPAEMRADLRGHPVWLGLAASDQGQLRLKPQNLLLNLPLAASS